MNARRAPSRRHRAWRGAIAIVVTASVVGAACGDDTADSTPPPAVGVETSTTDAPSSIGTAGGTPNAAPDGASSALEVELLTDDGLTIVGTEFGDSAAPGVVLGHMRGTGKETWFEFAETLAASGMRAIAIDFRGYGESEGEADTALDVDYRAAIDYLAATGSEAVHLVGASMGGTGAVVAAVATSGVSSIVSLSGPAEFGELDALGAAASLVAIPSLFVAAADDPPYTQAALDMGAEANGRVEILDGSAHGTALLEEQGPALADLLVDFLTGS